MPLNVSTDLEPNVTSEQPFAPELKAVSDMTDRELLEEVVVNQRTMIRQQAVILTTFQDIQGTVMQGGIGGLIKGMMGR